MYIYICIISFVLAPRGLWPNMLDTILVCNTTSVCCEELIFRYINEGKSRECWKQVESYKLVARLIWPTLKNPIYVLLLKVIISIFKNNFHQLPQIQRCYNRISQNKPNVAIHFRKSSIWFMFYAKYIEMYLCSVKTEF